MAHPDLRGNYLDFNVENYQDFADALQYNATLKSLRLAEEPRGKGWEDIYDWGEHEAGSAFMNDPILPKLYEIIENWGQKIL